MPALRSIIVLAAAAAAALSAVPASALQFQAAPRNANGQSNLVDPDKRADDLMDQKRRSEDFSARPALGNMGLAAPFGPAATMPQRPFVLPR